MSPEQVAAVAAAIGTVLGGVVTAIIQWRKEKYARVVEVAPAEATAAQTITEAAKVLVEPLAKRVDALETEVGTLRTQRDALTAERDSLRSDRDTLLRHTVAVEAWIKDNFPEKAGTMPTLPDQFKERS